MSLIGRNLLKNIAADAPEKPGIYQMFSSENEILYVGKAKNIQNRLKNYLSNQLSIRIINLISQIHKIEYVTTENESEALLLESRLIKKYKPKFNILLKDDKSFPYIKLEFSNEFPKITKYRGAINSKDKFFGPFANTTEVNNIMKFLLKTFKLRSCSDSYFNQRKRACLEYQIGRCSAPCVKKISIENYIKSFENAVAFLSGNTKELQAQLALEMRIASEHENYELAATIRDKIKNLTYIQSSNSIDFKQNIDFIYISRLDHLVCISISFYKFGSFYGNKLSFFEDAENIRDLEILSSFIGNLYQNTMPPDEIIISQQMNDKEFLIQAISQIHNTKIKILEPYNKITKNLLLSTANYANEGLKTKLKTQQSNLQLYSSLEKILHLTPNSLNRIEIYDNSHIMGKYPIGGFVVASKNGFIKKDYRFYNLETNSGDDHAMFKEVFKRRFDKKSDLLPDLIIIDGGKGQLSTAQKIISIYYPQIPIISIAKGPKRNAGNETLHLQDGTELRLSNDISEMKYLQILRDEVHNFVINTHRKKRSQALSHSFLDDIENIGPKRKQILLNHFGSIENIKSATIKDISSLANIGKDLATSILNQLNNN
jgi:excinuclease ABC subunit C